ncbi:hypothetical protein Tco_0620779 [Tanacetum coccineum]
MKLIKESANILHANELASCSSAEGINITANSLRPGFIVTDIFRGYKIFLVMVDKVLKYFVKDVAHVWAATTCYVVLNPKVKGAKAVDVVKQRYDVEKQHAGHRCRIPLILDVDTLQFRRRQKAGKCLQHMIASNLNCLRWDSGEYRQCLQGYRNVIKVIYTSEDQKDKSKVWEKRSYFRL